MLAASQRAIAIGFPRWRASRLEPVLGALAQGRVFVDDVAAARKLHPGPHDDIMVWGATLLDGLDCLIANTGAQLIRIDDGFIGPWPDLTAPRSLVFDPCGIHFDATAPSRLETLLATGALDAPLCERAAGLRAMITACGIAGSRVDHVTLPSWNSGQRTVVVVPGEDESSAAVVLGGGAVRTNRGLLAAVRATRPDAFVVYVPHPGAIVGDCHGHLAAEAHGLADRIETGASFMACLARADEVHTMTSLAGFDALLRGVRVVTYGVPFYAGWGLTDDRAIDHPAWARRGRQLTLDQLCAAALLRYPRYWDAQAQCFDTPERAILTIASEFERMPARPAPDRASHGFWQRQLRKAGSLADLLRANRRTG